MSLRNERIEKLKQADLYLVLTSEFTAGRNILDVLDAAGEGGVRLVQLREKSLEKRELAELAKKFRAICDRHNMLMIMNDHVDIALYAGADGVHLGQSDLPLDAARMLGSNLILGRSTHSIKQAMEAQEQDADYINLGPIFATRTKSTPVKPLGIGIIDEVKPHLRIPFTVMGGIKATQIPLLLEHGAGIIAMVTELSQAPDITAKARELRSLWKGYSH